MAATQDTEITLGTAKLLSLFFGLVIVCAVFFALGYTLGRKSDSGFPTVAGAAAPAGTSPVKPAGSAGTPSAAPMTFYKAVEQKSADSQLTPAASDATSGASAGVSAGNSARASSGESETQAAKLPDPMAPIPGTGYFVQVAAVTKQDDADALVDALKKKQYPAFVAGNSAADKYFRVQLGPFGDIKEAESMRTRLINDGYNPILKK
jgi:cell division septation protein DedD